MIRRALRRLAARVLPAVALLLFATSASAQSCKDGLIICTNYGYTCEAGSCNSTIPGNSCCEYSCIKPGGGGSSPGEYMT